MLQKKIQGYNQKQQIHFSCIFSTKLIDKASLIKINKVIPNSDSSKSFSALWHNYPLIFID